MIWTALMEKSELDQVVDRVCSRFDIDPEQARRDASQLIDQLVANEMIAAA